MSRSRSNVSQSKGFAENVLLLKYLVTQIFCNSNVAQNISHPLYIAAKILGAKFFQYLRVDSRVGIGSVEIKGLGRGHGYEKNDNSDFHVVCVVFAWLWQNGDFTKGFAAIYREHPNGRGFERGRVLQNCITPRRCAFLLTFTEHSSRKQMFETFL